MSNQNQDNQQETLTVNQARHVYRIRARRMMKGFYAEDDFASIWGYKLQQVPGHRNLWDIYYMDNEEELQYYDTLNIEYHTSASSIVAEMEQLLPEGTLTEEDVENEDEEPEPSPSFQ